MTKIKFYGGVGTIGGNCIVLKDKDSRIMLDNGMCFSKENNYYKNFLNVRGPNDIRDYIQLGLIPEIEGIYGEKHIIDPCINELNDDEKYMFGTNLVSYESYKKEFGKPYIDAILISHAHLDHFRNIKFMSNEIPIICSEITSEFLRIISELNDKVDYLKDVYYVCGTKKGYLPGRTKNKDSEKRIIKPIKPTEIIKIGNFNIQAYPVDHSLSGAIAYKINTSDNKTIVYTGDIRFHGHEHERKCSEDFVKEISLSPVDVLISEGTRIGKIDKNGEDDVYTKVFNHLNADTDITSKLIFMAFPWKSITRFITVYRIACELKRILVIQPKLAYVIHHLQKFESLGIKDILKKENIKIYKPRKDSMTYADGDYVKAKECISFDTQWSENKKKRPDFDQILYKTHYGNDIYVNASELNKNANKYILNLDFFNLNELIDIRPPKESYFFNLKTEPFDEEGKLERAVLENWMKKFNLNFIPDYHASGHASGKEILDMISKINPKKIFPIHTEYPELFTMSNAENKIVIGKEYTI
jgi:ribonuclease J